MHQDATWYGRRSQPTGLCVRCGPSPLPKKDSELPKFSADVYCGQTARWIKVALGMELGLSPGDIVLDGDPTSPPQKEGGAPQFSAHVYCCQTAGWIKMALGTEVGLGPGHVVLDGDPTPLSQKGVEPPPNFRSILLWPNGWMHQNATWYGGRPQPRRLC